MTVISIAVMQDKLAETRQLKAKALGREVATFAMGMQSYTSYFSGVTSGYGSPASGTIKNGVNFLKSKACLTGGNIDTTSAGELDIGFIPYCGFLSNLNNVEKDQTTTMGSLGFNTKFERVASGNGYGSHLTAITAIDVFKGGNSNEVMMEESGLAALVAGGLSDGRAGGLTTAGYRVTFCLPGTSEKTSVSAEIRKMCTNNDNKIVLMTSTDSSSDIWLRTDGKNLMNNLITFNKGAESSLRGLVNINRLLIPDGVNMLSIEHDKKLVVEIDKTKLDVLDANLYVKGAGYIKSDNAIIAKKAIQADVILPYLGEGQEAATTSNYRMKLDEKSELHQVGLNSIHFGTNVGGRAGNTTNANISTDGNNESLKMNGLNMSVTARKELKLNSDLIAINGKSGGAYAKVKGNAQVGGLNVRMANGSFRTLAKLLPRYTLLGVTKVRGDNTEHISKSTYERLGCPISSLKPILVTQGVNMQGFFATGSKWVGITTDGSMGWPNKPHKTAGYAIENPHHFITYGESLAYVNDHGGSWTAVIDGLARQANHPSKGNAANRFGTGLLHVYCLNDLDKTVY